MIVQTIVGAVLLFAAPCPGNIAEGCTIMADDQTPVVYAGGSGRRHEWIVQHELGHIYSARTPGFALGYDEELFADRFAACHVPWTRRWMDYRRKVGYTRKLGRMVAECRSWGFRS